MNVTVFARRTDTLTQVYYDGYLSENISAIDGLLPFPFCPLCFKFPWEVVAAV